MRYFAQIENNLVVNVVVADPTWCSVVGGVWVEYSNEGDNVAGVGYSYDSQTGTFIAPQPFPSWTLDSNHDWQPPTPKPEGNWMWDESELAWVEVPVG